VICHFIIQMLEKAGVHVPSAFSYLSTRMLLAFLMSFFLTFWMAPRSISWLYRLKTGQSIRVEDCPVLAELHKKKKDTPTMGGLFFLFAALVSCLFWVNVSSKLASILLLTVVMFMAIGFVDDYLKMNRKNSKGLSAKKKFLFQVVSSLILSYLFLDANPIELSDGSLIEPFRAYFLPFMKNPIFLLKASMGIAFMLVSCFIITGSSNAVNLTDGLDGLASGLFVFAAKVFAILAFLSQNKFISQYLNLPYIADAGEIGIILLAISGSVLAFLWYNGFPAQVFMGDTGSIALGATLGMSSIILRKEFLLAIVGFIFVMEAMSVMIQVFVYKLKKRRVFLCAPIHHHFECKGWPETKVVIRFWIMGLILAVIGLTTLKLQ
jgi:phospho-N-acetylmuramoyl-pentapeptide-transferase